MKNILIVEDEAITALSLRLLLENELKYSVVSVVDSGEKAVAETKDKTPDLIFMDIQLKGRMNGIEAAKIIRSFNDVPIVFASASSNLEEKIIEEKVTYTSFINKPLRDEGIKEILDRVFLKETNI